MTDDQLYIFIAVIILFNALAGLYFLISGKAYWTFGVPRMVERSSEPQKYWLVVGGNVLLVAILIWTLGPLTLAHFKLIR